jgi:hypothetical protein
MPFFIVTAMKTSNLTNRRLTELPAGATSCQPAAFLASITPAVKPQVAIRHQRVNRQGHFRQCTKVTTGKPIEQGDRPYERGTASELIVDCTLQTRHTCRCSIALSYLRYRLQLSGFTRLTADYRVDNALPQQAWWQSGSRAAYCDIYTRCRVVAVKQQPDKSLLGNSFASTPQYPSHR